MQCSRAQSNFTDSTKDKDLVPFVYHVCTQSLSLKYKPSHPWNNTNWNSIFECKQSCQRKGIPNGVLDEEIRLPFEPQRLMDCLNQYCYIPKSSKQIPYYEMHQSLEECKQKSTTDECKVCQSNL